MAALFSCPDDDEDSQDLESPPAEPKPFDWNQWGIEIDAKSLDALLGSNDDELLSVDIH